MVVNVYRVQVEGKKMLYQNFFIFKKQINKSYGRSSK